jgi:hypothetical protein
VIIRAGSRIKKSITNRLIVDFAIIPFRFGLHNCLLVPRVTAVTVTITRYYGSDVTADENQFLAMTSCFPPCYLCSSMSDVLLAQATRSRRSLRTSELPMFVGKKHKNLGRVTGGGETRRVKLAIKECGSWTVC